MLKSTLAVLLLCQLVFAFDRQPNADYQARRKALAESTKGGAVLLFASTEEEGPNDIYGYRPDNNFFYLSGWSEPGAALLIVAPMEAKEDRPASAYTEILFLPAHNRVQEKWTGPKLGPEDAEALKVTGFDKVEPLDSLRDELTRLLPATGANLFTDVPGPGLNSNSSMPLQWLRRANAFPLGVAMEDARPMIAALRVRKDDREVALIQKAVDASIAAHFAALHTVKPDITEREVSALLQYEWGKRGCERPAYSPIVGAGFNSTVLHYSDDSGVARDGDVLLIDAAGEYSLYASDITRTMPVNGKFTARQREIYDIVLGAQKAAMSAFQSGKSTLKKETPNSLFKVAYDYINTHGKDLHGQPLGKYFFHGLGHYVGLEVHDVGDYTVPLAPGMVFTIEPGIYIPEEKLGVRIEDMYYVDKSGKLVQMTAALPHTAEEVEQEMARR
ncbi:MAG TPA: Xaa-Pro aminopeptidase [Terriglobales bacterium]